MSIEEQDDGSLRPHTVSRGGRRRRASDRLTLWALILGAFLVLGLSVLCGTLRGAEPVPWQQVFQ